MRVVQGSGSVQKDDRPGDKFPGRCGRRVYLRLILACAVSSPKALVLPVAAGILRPSDNRAVLFAVSLFSRIRTPQPG